MNNFGQAACDHCGKACRLRSCYLADDDALVEKLLCEACFQGLGGISTAKDLREAEATFDRLESRASSIKTGMSPDQVKDMIGDPHEIDSLDNTPGRYVYIYFRYAFEIRAEFRNDRVIETTMKVR